MRHIFQRHPIPVKAWFRHSLVLTFAFPAKLLEPLLPPGLVLDTFEDFGFVAIAMVQTRGLRPIFFPRIFGQNFFLTGYRIFSRYRTRNGQLLRGLRILRSDTDKQLMVWAGNLLTHYHYRHARAILSESENNFSVVIQTPNAEADLDIIAQLAPPPETPPRDSPFRDFHQARLFAGPLPFTFDYERQTHSVILIEGVRQNWKPQPVSVQVRRATFFDRAPFNQTRPILANAFYVRDIPYMWKRGVRESLPKNNEQH
jgi:hypothetical protein